MAKRNWIFLFGLIVGLILAGNLRALEPIADQGVDPNAQEIPMLPILPGDNPSSNNANQALSPLTTSPAASTAPLPQAGGTDMLPPLPGDASSNASAAPGTLPPVPGNGSDALPPLPGEAGSQTTGGALPPVPGESTTSSTQAPSNALPPLPGEPAVAASAPGQANEVMPPLPGQEPAAVPVKTTATASHKPVKDSRPWEATKNRANAILGGWVKAKGGNETARLAYAAQAALDALEYHGYKVLGENGLYDGQPGAPGNQWRLITFEAPKVKRTLEVYVHQVGTKVWMRVGPSEPPPFSVNSVGQVKAIRADSLKALAYIRKELGWRMKPLRRGNWEAPYSFAMATADR